MFIGTQQNKEERKKEGRKERKEERKEGRKKGRKKERGREEGKKGREGGKEGRKEEGREGMKKFKFMVKKLWEEFVYYRDPLLEIHSPIFKTPSSFIVKKSVLILVN